MFQLQKTIQTIEDYRRLSKTIKDYQRPSKTIEDHRRLLRNIKEYRRLLKNIKEYWRLSETIEEYQRILKTFEEKSSNSVQIVLIEQDNSLIWNDSFSYSFIFSDLEIGQRIFLGSFQSSWGETTFSYNFFLVRFACGVPLILAWLLYDGCYLPSLFHYPVR